MYVYVSETSVSWRFQKAVFAVLTSAYYVTYMLLLHTILNHCSFSMIVYMIILYVYYIGYIDHRPPDRIWIIKYLTVTLEVCQMIAWNAVAVSCWALGSVGGTRRGTCGGFVQWPAATDWWTGGENGASWVQKLKSVLYAIYIKSHIQNILIACACCLLCFHHFTLVNFLR